MSSLSFSVLLFQSLFDLCSVEKNPVDLEEGDETEHKGFMQKHVRVNFVAPAIKFILLAQFAGLLHGLRC